MGAPPGRTRLLRVTAWSAVGRGVGRGAKCRAVPVCPESRFCLFLPSFTLSSLALTTDLPGGTEPPRGYSGRILGGGILRKPQGWLSLGSVSQVLGRPAGLGTLALLWPHGRCSRPLKPGPGPRRPRALRRRRIAPWPLPRCPSASFQAMGLLGFEFPDQGLNGALRRESVGS